MNNKWFVSNKRGGEVKLFCFPYAGGNASTYIKWSDSLPDHVQLIVVQPPGRSNRLFEPAYDNMSNLISALLPFFIEQLDRPYILYGHSLGSRVAYQLLIECRKRGIDMPKHVIVSGSNAAHIGCFKKILSALPEDEFVNELAKLNGTPVEILQNKEMMKLLLPTLRADFKIAEDYIAKPQKVDCPVSIFGGEHDDTVSVEGLMAWKQLFSQSGDVKMFPGHHFFIESHGSMVVAEVKRIISEVLPMHSQTNSAQVCV